MKKSKAICILTVLCIFISLCACGKDIADNSTEVLNTNTSVTSETNSNTSSDSSVPTSSDNQSSNNTEGEKDPDTTNEPNEDSIIAPEYKVILNDFITAFPYYNDDELNVPHNGSDMFRHHTALNQIGYALIDINCDNTKELVITGIHENAKPNCIYDMYTLLDGEVIHVFSSGDRSPYYLYNNGYIENSWANNTGESGHDFFKLENGKLKLIERVTYDAWYAEEIGVMSSIQDNNGDDNCYFKSNTDNKSDYVQITENEATKIIESYQSNGLLKIIYDALRYNHTFDKPHQNLTKTQTSAHSVDFENGDRVSIDKVGLNDVIVSNKTSFKDDNNNIFIYILNDDQGIENPVFYNFYLLAVYNETAFLLDFDASGLGNTVSLKDVTGDGNPEIIIQQELDAFGGMGQYYSYVYGISETGLTPIFCNLTRDYFDLGFKSENLPDKKVLVTNSIVDYSLVIDISSGYVDAAFDDEGKHYGSMEFDGCFYEFTPTDIDDDGVYEIEGWQYACYTFHNDGLGYAKCILKYDANSKSFKLVDAVFLPDEQYR